MTNIDREIGQIAAKVNAVSASVNDLNRQLDAHEREDNTRFATVVEKITKVRVLLAWMTGLGFGLTISLQLLQLFRENLQ